MKTLFIHLSDIHLSEPFTNRHSYDRLIDSIESFVNKADLIFLLFTGDMARRARKEELEYFSDFLSQTKKRIEAIHGHKIKVFVVPGNHDIPLNKPYPLEELLLNDEGHLDALAENSVKDMSPALEVCRHYGCFGDDDFVSVLSHEGALISYRFTLINSAPLASLQKNDKGHHRIPKSHLNFDTSKEFGKKTIDIFLSHHRPDWFDEETESALNAHLAQNISIAFFGHEHDPKAMAISLGRRKVFFSKGGELQPKKNQACGSFSLLILDEETLCVNETTVLLNYETGRRNYSTPTEDKVSASELYELQDDFSEWLEMSPLKCGKGTCFDFFVFPVLSQQTLRNDLLTVDAAIKEADSLGLMVLRGNSRSGKTMLLKAMFYTMQHDKPCVFFRANSELSNNPEKNIKQAFQEMYGEDPSLWLEFVNRPNTEKAIFIDNFGSLRKKKLKEIYLDYCKANFGTVVITDYAAGRPIEAIEDKILFPEESVFKIEGLTAKSRRELVSRVCRKMCVPEEYTERIGNLYEAMSASSKILDFIDPDYAIQLIETIVDQKLYLERDSRDAFTVVFGNTIINDIIRVGGERTSDDVITVLRHLAFLVWSLDEQKTITFEESTIMQAFTECKKPGLVSIDYSEAISIIENSGIIRKEGENRYRFKRNSYLAYFVARQIAFEISRGKNESIVKLSNEIERGINSDILLFLCFDQTRIDVVFDIQKKLNALLAEQDEIDFEEKSNAILRRTALIPSEPDANKVTKEQALEKKEAAERNEISRAQEREYSIFEEEELDPELQQMIRALKYIEIISKAAGSFPGHLTDKERVELVGCAVSSINKITQKLFNPTDEFIKTFDELVEEFKQAEIKRITDLGKGDTAEKIRKIQELRTVDILYSELLRFLTMLDSVYANCAASKRSIVAFDGLSTDKFASCLFKLYGYLYAEHFEKFIQILEKANNHFAPEKGVSIFQFFGRIYVLRNRCSGAQINKIASVTGIGSDRLLKIASREKTLKLANKK